MVKSKMVAKMVSIFGDVSDLQQRYRPWNIPHLVKKIKGFPLKVKSFHNIATYQKPKGGGSINSPRTTLGVSLYVYVRGLRSSRCSQLHLHELIVSIVLFNILACYMVDISTLTDAQTNCLIALNALNCKKFDNCNCRKLICNEFNDLNESQNELAVWAWNVAHRTCTKLCVHPMSTKLGTRLYRSPRQCSPRNSIKNVYSSESLRR